MALLRLQRWLRDHTEVTFETVCLHGGPLLDDFAALSPTRLGDLRTAAAAPAPAILFLNGSASLPVAGYLPGHGVRVLGYIHELELGQRLDLAGHCGADLFRRLDVVIVAADCVGDEVVQRWSVDRSRLRRLPPPIVLDLPAAAGPVDGEAAALGIDQGALVVGGAGPVGWRKGTDLFVELIRRLFELVEPADAGPDRPVHGVWLGAGVETPDFAPVAFDVFAAGLESRVHFLGERADPTGWFRRFDLLALTSREDPFPLVVPECAVSGTPAVCFDGAGGVSDLIAGYRPREVGWTVPYLDLEQMASLVGQLSGQPDRLRQAATEAAAVFRADMDIEVIGPQLVALLSVSPAPAGPA